MATENIAQQDKYSLVSLYGRGYEAADAEFVVHPLEFQRDGHRHAHWCQSYNVRDVIYYDTREEAEARLATIGPHRPNACTVVSRHDAENVAAR